MFCEVLSEEDSIFSRVPIFFLKKSFFTRRYKISSQACLLLFFLQKIMNKNHLNVTKVFEKDIVFVLYK